MRVSRIYYAGDLVVGQEVVLPAEQSKYVLNVLRLRNGTPLTIFNGNGGEFDAELVVADRKNARVKVQQFVSIGVESPLKIHLGQGICRGEKMDFVIQKAVELGVDQVTPLFTERCNVRLSKERAVGRLLRWQNIAIGACEQCGRNKIPKINQPTSVNEWLTAQYCGMAFVLHHRAAVKMQDIKQQFSACRLLIGPEGGLDGGEIELALASTYHAVKLGPRILRTETAGMAALAVLQSKWGDL